MVEHHDDGETIQHLSTGPEVLVIQADIPLSTPEDLFDVWTEPEYLTNWWPHQAEIDSGIGGRYHLSWPGMNWHLRGNYTQWERGHRLAFSWSWDHDPVDVTPKDVDIQFVALSGGSRLILTHGHYPDTPVAQEERRGHLEGWMTFLGRLQALAGHDDRDDTSYDASGRAL